MAFGKRRQTLDPAPIENRSLFSVKKRVPNPRVPEPGRMLLRQKFECKSFLILMFTISKINCSGANSASKIGAFLSSLELLGLKCERCVRPWIWQSFADRSKKKCYSRGTAQQQCLLHNKVCPATKSKRNLKRKLQGSGFETAWDEVAKREPQRRTLADFHMLFCIYMSTGSFLPCPPLTPRSNSKSWFLG
jgi:hypothetical protein